MSNLPVDLNELDTSLGAEQGYELELVAPNGRPLPGRIKVRGFDSATYQENLDAQQRRVLERTAMRRQATLEDIRDEAIEHSAALVIGWTVPFNLDGEPLEYSAANAKILLKRFPWIREQVERAAGVRANFLPASAGS